MIKFSQHAGFSVFKSWPWVGLYHYNIACLHTTEFCHSRCTGEAILALRQSCISGLREAHWTDPNPFCPGPWVKDILLPDNSNSQLQLHACLADMGSRWYITTGKPWSLDKLYLTNTLYTIMIYSHAYKYVMYAKWPGWHNQANATTTLSSINEGHIRIKCTVVVQFTSCTWDGMTSKWK